LKTSSTSVAAADASDDRDEVVSKPEYFIATSISHNGKGRIIKLPEISSSKEQLIEYFYEQQTSTLAETELSDLEIYRRVKSSRFDQMMKNVVNGLLRKYVNPEKELS
jgi:hypothetical protein